MKYFLFSAKRIQSGGGVHEFDGKFDSEEEARTSAVSIADKKGSDWILLCSGENGGGRDCGLVESRK